MRNKIKNYKEIEKNYAYDELALFFGQDYVINDKIRLHQPTIGEIVEYGERAYF